ncbi:Heparan sulfate 2-O-sulfotransferase 1 [Hypsibius exemplaris]|uniref:Heparan sulfate 2-O-sulfotransferase 1 n=1 Tax=Hypsibius exemplaris TaxID=2072580 RepID=A0A1W0WKT0_HYPEX|nr:Heparan sulfate 2-O-sulfotransferase 1 [Hypsibius exemplaris]
MFLLKLLLLICGVGIFVIFGLCTYLNGIGLESLMVKNDTCPRSDYRSSPAFPADLIVLYNRVPKTGSTSFTGLAYDLCSRNKFNVLHLNTSKNAHVLSLADQMRFAQNITRWTEKHPALFHGHLAWFDLTAFGVPRLPVYINIVRDPIDRLVSYYYFLRYGDDFRPYLSRRRQGDRKSIDECVTEQGKDCDPMNMWLQGDAIFLPRCRLLGAPGNFWALEQAKLNLANKYFLVGVTEEMEDFVALLEATLPSMFRGASDLYLHGEKSHLRKTFNKTTPLPATTEALRRSPFTRPKLNSTNLLSISFRW